MLSKLRAQPRTAVLAGTACAAILLLILFWVVPEWGSPPEVDAPTPTPVDEEVEVPPLGPAQLAAPIVYDLASVLQDLEEAVPRTFGDIEDRTDHPDHDRVQVAYRVERSPFSAEIHGDTARISAVLTYQGRAWYDPPVFPAVSAGCGLDEDEERPRSRVILLSRLQLGSDWTLLSEARVDTVEAVSGEDRDRCRVTPLGIDVTGTAVGAVRSALEGQTSRIDGEVAGIDLRSRLQEVWNTLEEPVQLTDDVWLLVNPRTIRHGGIYGEGTVLTLDVGMTAEPVILLGPPPDTVLTELPELETGAVGGQSDIRLEGRIHYPYAGSLLTRELQEEELDLEGRTFRIQRLALEGIGGGRVALEVEFDGSARGRIHLVGRPELDRDAGEIHIPDLDFDLETRNLLVGGLAWLGHERITTFLRDQARLPVAQIMGPAREQFLRGLNRDLSDEVSVAGDVLSAELLEVRALRDLLLVHARAEARATFTVRQQEGR